MGDVDLAMATPHLDPQNPSCPYYFHLGDNPNSVVATPILEGTKNYDL
jgi:hypothetical protein